MKHPLSTEAFVEWLQKTPTQRYHYTDNAGCAIYQYLQASGFPVQSVNPSHWFDKNWFPHPLPEGWNKACRYNENYHSNRYMSRTFGRLAKELQKAAKQHDQALAG